MEMLQPLWHRAVGILVQPVRDHISDNRSEMQSVKVARFPLATSIYMKTQAERALDYRAKRVHLPSSLGASCLPEVFVVTISNSVE